MGAQCTKPEHTPDSQAETHMDAQHGEETSSGIKKLAAALSSTNQKIYKTKPNHSFLVNLGIVMHHCKLEERYKTPSSSGVIFNDMATLMRSTRYAKYAAAAYQSDNIDIVKAIQQSDEADFDGNIEILHVSPASKKIPAFFIAFDKATNDLVLSIRGVGTMQEGLAPSISELAPFMDGNANGEILAQMEELVAKAKTPLEEAIAANPTASVAIVGHSTGAGVAILATMQGFGEGSMVEKLLKEGKAKCYAFGAPPVYDLPSKVPREVSNSIFSFVNGMDCIPRTSRGTLGKLLMAVREVDELDLDTDSRLGVIGSADPTEYTIPDHKEIPEDLSAEFQSLSGVGTVVLFFKGKDGRMHCEKLVPKLEDRIMLHPDMSTSHLIASYQDSINETLMQLQKTKGCC